MNPITFNFTGAIQNYTVPVSGAYDLSAFGAGGGSGSNGGAPTGGGGSGAEIGATFNFTTGQQLQIIVGGVGANSLGNGAGGGGGFTAILVNSGANGAYVPLLIAGAGGGSSIFGNVGADAPLFAPGNALGNGGNGGASINGSTVGTGGGGAGALSNGGSGSSGFAQKASGGFTAPSYAGGGAGVGGGGGGFGGGGGGDLGGGGGGGGSTGGGGGSTTRTANSFTAAGGGGGTSYLSNAGTLNAAETRAGAGTNSGNGSVRILAPVQPPAPCYVTDTRIRVLRGLAIQDVPVERLRVGDLAITASGKPRPIRWIGSRSYASLTTPQHDHPVRIKANALGDRIPARDLLVSPDHALLIDGLFVAAGHLVNGTSITRGEAVADLTYWHVELDSHDILLAEGASAESFLAAPGVRGQFDGTGTDDAPLAPVAYAARIEHGPELAALRERLILRAGLSIEPMRFGAVRAWMDRCDGIRIAGWAQDDAHPDAPVCLDVVVDGVVVAMTLADQYRADLAAAKVGDGRHGFDLDLDEPLAPGMGHTVEVRRSADGVMVCAMAVDAAGAWMPLLAA